MILYKPAVAALVLSLALTANRGAAAEPQTYKIGVQLPMTGERSSVGRLMLNGLQMALDTVNNHAGPQGPKFELVLADDESTTDGAVKALEKLVHDPQIIAIAGEINSPFVMASAPVVDKAGLPYLTAGSSPKTTLQSQWIFRVGASDALLADFLARYIVDELKIKSIAIMHDKTGIHNQRADLVATVLKDTARVIPVANVTWTSGDRQFGTQFEQVKASRPQAILALGETPEGGPFFRQAKASDIQGQIIAQRDFGVRRVFEEAGDAAEGALIFTEYAPDLQGDSTWEWNAAYKKLFASDANVIAAQYNDALLLLAEAVKTDGPTRAGIKSGLEHLKSFHGVMADYTFDSGRNGVHRFYVARVTGGKLSLVKTLNEEPTQ
jgi:branched-chain amino acid transport system substrate-binding protein